MTDLTFDPAAPRPLTDLIGLDPNFTGGLSAEEHLRRQRCGECDEALNALAAAREELAEAQREEERYRQEARDSATQAGRALRELAEAKMLLHTIWYGTVNAPARERWLRLMRDAVPAATPQATCGDSGLHPGWVCDLPAGHAERQHRQQVSGGVNTWEHHEAAVPGDGPGHCGLCGSEDCPGKPGEGCMSGPFEAYDPIAVLDEAIATSGARITFDPRRNTAPHTHRGPKVTDPDREHPAHDGQTCEEYEAAVPGDGEQAATVRTALGDNWSQLLNDDGEQAATTSHGWTSHGYACCGEAKTGERPNARARCMGNPRCVKCKADAERIHAALPTSGQP